ncbi:MAG: hypothetical protein AAGE52_18370 [Myxococcota bacterium]
MRCGLSGEDKDGWTECLFGSGDLYTELATGFDRYGKWRPYTLKELRREQSGIGDWFHESDERREVRDETPAWYFVGGPASLYAGVWRKPGKVPAELGDLDAYRPELPDTKPHKRTVVGVRIADTDTRFSAVRVEPGSAPLGAVTRTLGTKNVGFVIVPRNPSARSGTPPSSTPVERDPHLARFEKALGPLESDGKTWFSSRFQGEILRLDEPEDPLAAWFGVDDFAFNDRAADVPRWEAGTTTLVEVVVELETSLHEVSLACFGSYLLIARGLARSELFALLGLPKDAVPTRSRQTLGHG